MSEHEQDCGMPEPSKEHGMLMETVGTWDVDCTFYMGPEAMQCKATETVEAVGQFWTVSRFVTEMMGMPFVGRCTMGFDQRRGKWVGTWIDSMGPHMHVMEGERDEASGTLAMAWEGPAPMTGDLVPYRSVLTTLEDGGRRFEMFMTLPDAGEVPMASYVYTRAE